MIPAHQQVKNGDAFKFFKDYWFIVALIFSIAMAWATLLGNVRLNTRVNETQDIDIKANRASIGSLELKYTQDVAVIKTQLESLLKQKQNER